ncbi:MAG: Glu/Leu/Phe/Val dehydrogenase dimerization domain-containing protein [Acidimicrobiia bacterium]
MEGSHDPRRSTLRVFDLVETGGHESVHFGADPETGYQSIIAIHDTTLGPALGGTRFYPYASEEAALVDVLRLARGMTYKAACAGLDQGGGKAVIIGDPATVGNADLFRSHGRFVDSLGGTYITAEDVGTTVADMVIVREETRHVAGLPIEHGGSGDPSPATARGVIAAMTATAEHIWGTDDLAGRRIAIKGVGKVGMSLAERLHDRGAELVVADVNQAATDRAAAAFDAKVTSVDDIHAADCDIFAPCALGSDLSHDTIPQLSCAAVVGSANNQLATPDDSIRLMEAGVVYAPDFVANAGGIINIAVARDGYSLPRAIELVEHIRSTVAMILKRADDLTIDTHRAAELIAEERIALARAKEHK